MVSRRPLSWLHPGLSFCVDLRSSGRLAHNPYRGFCKIVPAAIRRRWVPLERMPGRPLRLGPQDTQKAKPDRDQGVRLHFRPPHNTFNLRLSFKQQERLTTPVRRTAIRGRRIRVSRRLVCYRARGNCENRGSSGSTFPDKFLL